jgi:hypothetical protein
MARLTKEEILAQVTGLQNARVIIRKLPDGGSQIVIYHGPNDAREQIILDRGADARAIRAKLEQSN